MNRDLQFCITWRIGDASIGHHLVVSDRLMANRLTEIFQSFCLKVDFVYLLTIRLKLEIVLPREITTKIEKTFFLVGGCGPIS